MVELLFDDQDRTRRVLDHSFGGAANQETFETGVTVGADDNQIGSDLFGGADDLIVWIPDPQEWLGLHPSGDDLFNHQRQLRVGLTL